VNRREFALQGRQADKQGPAFAGVIAPSIRSW